MLIVSPSKRWYPTCAFCALDSISFTEAMGLVCRDRECLPNMSQHLLLIQLIYISLIPKVLARTDAIETVRSWVEGAASIPQAQSSATREDVKSCLGVWRDIIRVKVIVLHMPL